MPTNFNQFIKDNLSKGMMNIFIPVFFGLTVNCFTGYQRYNDKQEYEELKKSADEVKDVYTKVTNENTLLNRSNKYGQISLEIAESRAKRVKLLTEIIDNYRYNESNKFPVELSNFYIEKIDSINLILPLEIGKMKAYVKEEVLGRNNEKTINIDLLKSELSMNSDLIEFLKGKLKKNSVTTEKVNNFVMNVSAFTTYQTDSLNIVNYETTKFNAQEYKNKLDSIKKNYKLWRLIYFIGIFFNMFITIFMTYFFLKFDYHK